MPPTQAELDAKKLEDDEKNLEDDKLTDEEKAAEARVVARLKGKIDENTEDTKALAALNADPDIRKLVEMKQAGIAFVLGEEKKKPDEPDVDPLDGKDLDALTNSEIVPLILDSIGKKIGAVLDEKLAPLTGDLDSMKKRASQADAERIGSDVEAARKKYSDLDNFKQDMLDIHEQNPGLSVEELYLMARIRKGGLPDPRVESENPRSSLTRPSTKASPEDRKKYRGRRGFAQILDDKLGSD